MCGVNLLEMQISMHSVYWYVYVVFRSFVAGSAILSISQSLHFIKCFGALVVGLIFALDNLIDWELNIHVASSVWLISCLLKVLTFFFFAGSIVGILESNRYHSKKKTKKKERKEFYFKFPLPFYARSDLLTHSLTQYLLSYQYGYVCIS